MSNPLFYYALVVGLIAGGCTNTQRSRDLANVNVPPTVTAIQVCSDCHGVDGTSVSPNFPRLAGQPVEYLTAQLQNFRSHHRSDPAGYEYMWGLTHGLTDAQIAGLAEYFSAQVPRRNASVQPALLPLGKKIFEEGVPERGTPPCSACHGADGKGMGTFPRLALQHQEYLIKQLRVFKSTEQRPGTPMTQVTHNLTSREIKSVAAYLQAFPSSD